MTHIPLSDQTAARLKALSEKSERSIDEIVMLLIERYEQALLADETGGDEDVTWSEEEVAEMLRPKKPLTGQEIVEQGFTGGWEDMGIEDSVEWLAQQRAKRRKKLRW
jgi:hypothetical protein